MVEERLIRYDRHGSSPIPTYDQAVNAYPSSSQSFLGSEETSNNAEKEGFLNQGGQIGHQALSVESSRSSLSLSNTPRASTVELRHEILTQMELLEPEADGQSMRATLLGRNRFTKCIVDLTHSLSFVSFHQLLPFRDYRVANISTLIRQIQRNWAIMLTRSLALTFVIILLYLFSFSHVFTIGRKGPHSTTDFPDMTREFLRSSTNASSIREYSKYLTLFDHVAGTKGSYVLGEFVQDLFVESQLEDVQMEQFDVYASNKDCCL